MAKITSDPHAGIVLIVDDDPFIRDSMQMLFRSVGLEAHCYASAGDVLEATMPETPSCLIVDVRMPHIGGFEFQRRMAERGNCTPIIFVTGHGDIAMTVRAMKAGAIDFLSKPFRDQEMLDAISVALERDKRRRARDGARADTEHRHAELTPREIEVMDGVVQGLLNKQIAGRLGVTEVTVKLHRANVMRKMGARTLPDLVRMAEVLGSGSPN